jgi:cobaltochelatase CobS
MPVNRTANLRSRIRRLRKEDPILREALSAAEANGLRAAQCEAVLDKATLAGSTVADIRNAAFGSTTPPAPKVPSTPPAPKVPSPPAPKEKPVTTGSPIADAITTTIDSVVGDRISALEESMADTISKLGATSGCKPVQFNFPDRDSVTIDDVTHEVLPDLVGAVSAGFANLLLCGPAGTGKTTLAGQLAESLSLPFGSVSCTAGLSESVFTGRIMPSVSGEWTYRSTQFVDLFTGGGVFLADEFDAADPNLLTLINSALANGFLHNPVSEETLKRHDDFVFVAATNTWGYGADRQYTGRSPLDAATLDRFTGAKFHVDYSEQIEDSIWQTVSDSEVRSRLRSAISDLRSWIKRERAPYVVGTRSIVAAAKLAATGTEPETVLSRLTVDWSEAHRKQAGL